MSLRRSKPPIKRGSAPEEEEDIWGRVEMEGILSYLTFLTFRRLMSTTVDVPYR
jgi:hypothetical protein